MLSPTLAVHPQDFWFMDTYSNTNLGTSLKGFCRYDWNPDPVDLKVGRLSRWAWSYEVSPFKVEIFLKVEQLTSEIQSTRRDLMHCCWIEDGGGLVLRNAGGLKEIKSGPHWQRAKKLRPLSIFNQWPEWIWRQSFSWGPQIKAHPRVYLVHPKQRTQLSQTWGLQIFEINHLYCFKSLHL